MHLPVSRTSAGVLCRSVASALLARVRHRLDAEVAGQALQLAVVAAVAGLAVAVVLGEEQLDDRLARLADALACWC